MHGFNIYTFKTMGSKDIYAPLAYGFFIPELHSHQYQHGTSHSTLQKAYEAARSHIDEVVDAYSMKAQAPHKSMIKVHGFVEHQFVALPADMAA